MVFGDVVRERIQLNEESLWVGKQTQTDADAREALPKIQQLLHDGKGVSIGPGWHVEKSYIKDNDIFFNIGTTPLCGRNCPKGATLLV